MAVIDQIAEVKTWLAGILTADSTLTALVTGIYNNNPPEATSSTDVVYPVLVVQQVTPLRDVRPAGPLYVMSDGIWMVKAIDKSRSAEACSAIMNRVYALLDNQAGNVLAGRVLFFQRIDAIERPYVDSGVEYQQVIARFRVQVQ